MPTSAALQLLSVLLLATGCAIRPPERVWIDPTMPEAETAMLKDVLAHWCQSSARYCPERVEERAGAGGKIFWDTNYSRHGRSARSAAFTRKLESTVIFDAKADLGALFWRMAAHEIGHLSGAGHARSGILATDVPLKGKSEMFCIDAATVALWCKHENCDGRVASGTCPNGE